MKHPLIVAAAAAALTLGAMSSQAAVITSSYSSLGGNSWLANLTVTNDGNPTTFAGFTVDFPNATNLALVSSPANWDSLIFQADPSLPDFGYLDSMALGSLLAVGQSVGGFGVSFSLAGGARPGSLPFMLYDANFNPVAAGNTTIAAIPEPATALLAALGLAFVGLRNRRLSVKTRQAAEEVTA
ncbi:PEP-CTERM sorting domain-containing protein [Piscinibacter koreensis]|uniref:PEP-CTERM sorting domain-containing protein n=1 Tax=Piscinibacter koreensis TaxID=2742824 RepID=A0A7Y6NS85_9BURK|nr:PEP-CTERM sorting domain-containing protein [Schlegelella koreensis]NUZ08338.1 PEP-CTERM sorting domain-containing protein [Schlegelella koreensis]